MEEASSGLQSWCCRNVAKQRVSIICGLAVTFLSTGSSSSDVWRGYTTEDEKAVWWGWFETSSNESTGGVKSSVDSFGMGRSFPNWTGILCSRVAQG